MSLRGGESESRELEGQQSESRELESERLIRFMVCKKVYNWVGFGVVSLKPTLDPNPFQVLFLKPKPDPIVSRVENMPH